MKKLAYGIMIEGSLSFIERTEAALKMVSTTMAFRPVRPYLSRVKEAHRSGMKAYDAQPTFEVGRSTWRSPLVWYASAMVHEACHSMLYHQNQKTTLWIRYTEPNTWTGKAAEQKCLRLQLQALRELNADASIIMHVLKGIYNPTYQDVKDRDW